VLSVHFMDTLNSHNGLLKVSNKTLELAGGVFFTGQMKFPMHKITKKKILDFVLVS